MSEAVAARDGQTVAVGRRLSPGALSLLLMSVAGLGIAAYLTTVHYAGVPLFCPSATAVLNCASVTTSAYSVVPGTDLPVTIPGMVWFVVSGGIAGAALALGLRGRPEPPGMLAAHVVWCVLGMAAVLDLVFDEAVRLHQLCEWCTAVHVLVFASLLVAFGRLQRATPTEEID